MDAEKIVALKWLLEMLGIGMILFGVYLRSKVAAKMRGCVKLDAVIKDYNVSGTPNAKGRIIRYFTPLYEFEYGGKKYVKEAEIKTEKQPYAVGKTVKLHFDPKTKTITAGNELRMAAIMYCIPMVIGVILIGVGYFGIS